MLEYNISFIFNYLEINKGKVLHFSDMHTDEEKYEFALVFSYLQNNEWCFYPWQVFNRAKTSASFHKTFRYESLYKSKIKIY